MDILSAYDNIDVMLGDENYNSIERELDNVIDVCDLEENTDFIPYMRMCIVFLW